MRQLRPCVLTCIPELLPHTSSTHRLPTSLNGSATHPVPLSCCGSRLCRLFCHTQHPLCEEIPFVLLSRYIQDLTTSHCLTMTTLVQDSVVAHLSHPSCCSLLPPLAPASLSSTGAAGILYKYKSVVALFSKFPSGFSISFTELAQFHEMPPGPPTLATITSQTFCPVSWLDALLFLKHCNARPSLKAWVREPFSLLE